MTSTESTTPRRARRETSHAPSQRNDPPPAPPAGHARLLLHVIFSTHEQKACFEPALRKELAAYLGGIARRLQSPARAVAALGDHVHLLLDAASDVSPAALVTELKKGSAKWLRTKAEGLAAFAWQDGGGLFSVSQSAAEATQQYIAQQDQHHAKLDFREEYRRFVDRHQIKADEATLYR